MSPVQGRYDGAAVARRWRVLSSTADVFVQNFRTGVVERLGLGADVLRAANPRLVYASISGFGTTGRLVDDALSHEPWLPAPGLERAEPRERLHDMVVGGGRGQWAAYSAAQAVTAALLARAATGRGTRVDVSMLDVAAAFVWPDGMMNHTCAEPDEVLPPVSRSFRVTPTADAGRALGPRLGEHADEVLREAGLAAGEVRDLRATGAVR